MTLEGLARTYWARVPLDIKYCCLCKSKLASFTPYRAGLKSVPPLMKMLDVIGSDVEQCGCPKCGCHDRERHLFLYLSKLGIMQQFCEKSILHFAPERVLSKEIEKFKPKLYVKGDLFPTHPGIQKIDMMSIPYDSNTFDFVIANHVLEHVPSDLQALKELHRVLKNGGKAILQTPYSAKLQSTWSDEGIDSDDSRLYAFGQEDHVRLHGRDIFDRFMSVGFKWIGAHHQELLPEVDVRRFGVNPKEPLFLFEKI